MQKLKVITALLCTVMLSGCQELEPVSQTTATTTAIKTSGTELSVTTVSEAAGSAPDNTTESSESSETPFETPSSPEPVQTESTVSPTVVPDETEEELPAGTIRTASKDYREIARLVLKSVYGDEADFSKELPSYLAKGYVDDSLWFAVRFTLGNDEEAVTREALIKQDEPETYSLVTINKRVPTDNLIEDENAPRQELMQYLCYMLPFQDTGIFESDCNFKNGELPSSDVLVHAAQRLIGEQPEYDEEAVLNALAPYVDVKDEYLKTASCYRQENECYCFSEYGRTYQYALKSAVTVGSVHTLTIYAAPSDEHEFTRQIILSVEGTPEEFKLLSCKASERTAPEYTFPVTVAEGMFKSSSMENLTVKLRLSDGYYYEAGGHDGLFKSGFRGNYELILENESDELCRVPAEIDGFGFLTYPGAFNISVSDLCGDGTFEFALGIWDENGTSIQLYRIKDNEIIKLHFDGVLKIKADGFSPVLQLSEEGFSAEVYDEETDGFILKEFVLTEDSATIKEAEPENEEETEE